MVWCVKQEQIELSAKQTAQNEIIMSFKYVSHISERVEEFEIVEFLFSQINGLKNDILKAVCKHNTYVQTFCWISQTLSLAQTRNTDRGCECVFYVVIYCASFEVVATLMLKIQVTWSVKFRDVPLCFVIC
jgi:hypothetical protein